MDAHDQTPSAPAAPRSAEPVEEWPPREWRETTRAAGHRQALFVMLAMLVMFGVLSLVAVWAAHKG